MAKLPSIQQATLGFTVIETLLALSILTSSYLVIFSTQQWLSASAIRQEAELKALLQMSDQHEIKIAQNLTESE